MLTVLGNGWHPLLALRVSHPVIYKFMLSVQFLFLAISFPESSFPLTSGRETTSLRATISGMRHRCRLRSETGWAESPEFGYFKMVAPRALVFQPLAKKRHL